MHTKQFSSAQPIVPTLCVSEVGVSHRVLCTPSQHAWPGRPRGERTEMSRLGNLRHTLSPCCRKRDCPMGCTASAAAAVPAGEREIEPRKGGHGNTRIIQAVTHTGGRSSGAVADLMAHLLWTSLCACRVDIATRLHRTILCACGKPVPDLATHLLWASLCLCKAHFACS